MNMSSVILENQGKGTMRGILVDTVLRSMDFELGDYKIRAVLAGNRKPGIAAGLIIQTGPEEYIVAGKGFDLFFVSKDPSIRIGLDIVDDGTFKDGEFVPERRLNGDETHASTWSGTGLKLPDNKVSVQKVSLYWYK